MSFIKLSDRWNGDITIEGTVLAINRTISRMQPASQVKKIQFQSSRKLNSIPQILICTGKNALEYAYSVIEHSIDNFNKIIVFQAKGYETVDQKQSSKLTLYMVDHPIPRVDNIEYSEKFVSYLKNLDEPHLIHFIITGGTSSCLSLPESNLKFSDYVAIIKSSIAAGLNIFQLNEIRSTLDQLKAGKLSLLLKSHHLYTWIVSDVLTNEAKIVGSGPTIPGIVLTGKTKTILESIISELEISMDLNKLQVKLNDVSEFRHPNHHWSIILNNIDFSKILINQLKHIIGPKIYFKLISTVVQEDVLSFANTIYNYYLKLSQPTILIWMGELTNELNEEILNHGKGGRVSYFSFVISKLFKESSGVTIISFATDGHDGTSPKSCYIINNSTYDQIIQIDNYDKIIENGNTGLILDIIGHAFEMHQTNINLADVFILIKN
ncbi:MAG: Glycerate 2-kinase [Candidatus Heimdallarchaeota archaeon LC_2]|nr:MAG: Glycerate 2-kinase [Candidatus Heimdallarchaeota archaeon LC_2]